MVLYSEEEFSPWHVGNGGEDGVEGEDLLSGHDIAPEIKHLYLTFLERLGQHL